MSAGFAISAFIPQITSNGIFSTRRVNQGAEYLNNNPCVGLMNIDIAAGQGMNIAKGVSNIAQNSKNSLSASILNAEQKIKTCAKNDKVIRGIGSVVNFTADNINKLITAAGVVKVLCADDKESAAIQESLALGTMFASEAVAKRLIGMPKYEYKDGKKVAVERKGWYKSNLFLEKQASAFTDYCQTKKVFNKSLKYLPGCLKGLGFALASIGGYKLGLSAADLILQESKKTNAA